MISFRTTFLYDNAGNRTSVEDANGKISQSVYFANRNQVQASVDAMGFRTTYAYDLQGRLQSTQDANGHFVTNVYDSMGRLQFVVNALSENARQYGYDLAGRMVTYADAANRVRTYTYDAAGQNTSIHFPDGKIATYGFDVLGRRTTMSDWGGVSTYTFDARGQMSGKTASGYVQSYDYDPNGNRTTLTLGGVGVITYVFDELNRLTSAQKPTGELYTMMYDVDSRRTTMQLGNGTKRAYSYDANSRLTTQIELNGATRLVTIVDSYDPVGNRIGRNLDGVLTTWTYDDLYRLTHQDKPGQVCTYVLDPVGNLEVMWEGGASPKSFTFDAADRLETMALGANLTTFTYTTYGALEVEVTGIQRTTYTYDGQDQLIGVLTSAGVRSTYTFDGDGMRRTAQEGNVQPTTMVWDGSDYLFLDGPSADSLVLTLDGEIVACGSKDLLTDPLGTLLREISASASLSSLFSMYPYGSPVLPAFSTPTIPFRYIAAYGYYFDTNDRDYVRARELEKRLGRWMQADPIWPFQRAVSYVGAAPMAQVDPSGLRPSSSVECNSKWNEYIYTFCSTCHKNPNPKCVTECNALAAWYYELCGKRPKRQPHWAGMLPGNWVPHPGVGIAPGPHVMPPKSVFTGPPRPCWVACIPQVTDHPDINANGCLRVGFGLPYEGIDPPGGPTFNIWSCRECCFVKFTGATLDRCLSGCGWSMALCWQIIINQFEPGREGSAGSYPVPKKGDDFRR